jgi:hypothetical protein
MTDDPIIEEVHRAKDELARVHEADLHSLFETLREADAVAGRAVVTGAPVRIPSQPSVSAGPLPGVPRP